MKASDLPQSILALNQHLFMHDTEPMALPQEQPQYGKPNALEKELQRLAELELGRREIWYLHLSPRAREKRGCPDIICCVRGRFVGIELKSAIGRLSESQVKNLEHIRECDGHTAVVRTMTEFIELLDKLGGVKRRYGLSGIYQRNAPV